jgi:hypothetical protein
MAPAVLYCVDLLAERRTYGRFVFAAAMWTQLLFAGHPETAAHLFWLASVYLLWLLFAERVTPDRGRLVLTLGGVMTVAALLSLPYLVPLLETGLKSKRAAELKAAPLQAGGLPYSDWPSAVVMLQPHFFGQVPYEIDWGPADTEPLGGYAGVLALVAFLANIAGVVTRRAWRSRELLYAILTLFLLAVLFNFPGAGDLFHWMMPIAAHARVRLLFVLLAALQAAAAIDFAPSSARLKASTEPMSGFFAPAFTATPMPQLAKARLLPAATLPCFASWSIASPPMITASAVSPRPMRSIITLAGS